MYLEIITPEQTLYKGDVESILFPGSHGDFQVLNNHAPIVSTLTKGKVKIIGKLLIEDSAKDKFQFNERETLLEIESGTVEMNNNKLRKLCLKLVELSDKPQFELKNKVVKNLSYKGWEVDLVIKTLNQLIK